MQLSGDIGRRHNDGKWLFIFVYFGLEILRDSPIGFIFYTISYYFILFSYYFLYFLYSFSEPLKAPDIILAVILRLNNLSNDHIIPGLLIHLYMHPLAFFMALNGFSQR